MTIFKPESPELIEYLKRVASRDFEKVKWPLYRSALNHANECAAHGVYDQDKKNPFFNSILKNERPNESESVRRHRLDVFTQCTLDVWGRAKTALGKMFNPKLYQVNFPEWPKENLESLAEYLDDLPGEIGSLATFFREPAFEKALTDPMAVIALFPDPETLGIENEFIKPIPKIYGTERVIDRKSDEYFLIWSYEKSDIGTADRPDMTGNILYLFDGEFIHKITQLPNGPQAEIRYQAELYHTHGIGFPPVVELPGIHTQEDGHSIRKSFFTHALPSWMKALTRESDLDAVTLRNAHPKAWQLKMPCPSCKGVGNITNVVRGLPTNSSCESCGGTGDMNSRLGPAGVMLLNPAKMGEYTGPLAGYINPDSSVLKLMREEVEYYKDAGMTAIHMEDSMSDTRAGESGEAKKIDRENQETFFKKVADGIFGAWELTSWYIAAMRYTGVGLKADEIAPDILPPTDFDLYTTEELAARATSLKASGVSTSIISGVEKTIIRKEYQDDPEEQARLISIAEIDPLPGVTGDELLTRAQYTREIDMWVHTNLGRLVDEAMDADPDFVNKPLKIRRAAVYAIAKAEMPVRPAPMPIFDPNADE